MGRDCSVCVHEDRNIIDQRLISGTPTRQIADEFGVGRESVNRHKKNHLPVELLKSKRLAEISAADNLIERVESLFDKALSLLGQAEGEKKFSATASLLKEARSSLELIGKISGELKSGTVVNLTYSPQWTELRNVLITTLEPHPEIKAEVVQALEEAEHHEIIDG